jgi:hypothetical protein
MAAARIDDPDLPINESSGHCAQERRSAGTTRDARLGAAVDAKKILERGARHGANLRRADERHQLRHLLLHVTLGPHVGGPLALVQTMQPIELDVTWPPSADAATPDEVLETRLAHWQEPAPKCARWYAALDSQHLI